MITGRSKAEIIERSRAIRIALAQMDQEDIRARASEKQSGLCAMCNEPVQALDGVLAQLGHAVTVYHWAEQDIPIEEALAGANAEKNLVVLHTKCQFRQEFIELERFLERVRRGEIRIEQPEILTPEEAARERRQDHEIFSALAKKAMEVFGPKRRD